MSSLARAVKRPQLKYTVMLLILLVWMAQAAYDYFDYWYTAPSLNRSLLKSMLVPEFLGRAIVFTFIAICLLRSWTYVFSNPDPSRGRRSLKLLGTVVLRVCAALVIVNLWNMFQNSPTRNCDEYTRLMTTAMGGNIFEEGGRRYEVKLCAVPSFAPLFSGRMRLQLLSADNDELLAERIFYWSSGSNGFWDSRIISTDPGKLNYGWGDGDDGYEGRLSLPPTKLDWLRARLP
jgi:hypothetical protein